jgi:putative intracellular protease/amidase
VGTAVSPDALEVTDGHADDHPAMFDLATDTNAQRLIKDFYQSDKIVSAVCHGPAAFVNVQLDDGTHLLDGHDVSCLTNAEEDAMGGSSSMPFMLETEITAKGAKVFKTELFGAKVVRSGKNPRLITGQNPMSGAPLAEALLAALQ